MKKSRAAAGGRESDPGPVLDIRVRWRVGQVALVLAGLLAVAAVARPLATGAPPLLRLGVTLALGLGLTATALLTGLRGRGQAEVLAFYAFLVLSLDAVGQLLAPLGWPVWPLMVLLLGGLAVAEPLPIALGAAALASLLATADAAAGAFAAWKGALAAALGYGALVLALSLALQWEKRKLENARHDLARLRHGLDELDEAGSATVSAVLPLRQVSEEGRRARQLERAAELDDALRRLVEVAKHALGAHAVVYFDLDRDRESAYVRAAEGPPALNPEAVASLRADPFAFILDRQQPFYATDYKRLLWSLPYYRGEVKVGSLLAVPVCTGEAVHGVLVADRLEAQALVGREVQMLAGFASLLEREIARARAAASREEIGAEFKAAYGVSNNLAAVDDAPAVRRLLLQSAAGMAPLEAAAVVAMDEAGTRYVIEEALGWAGEFLSREVALGEKTWAGWVLRSAEDAYLLDNLAGRGERMPVLVLDEGAGRAESLLAVPLRTRGRTLGALMLTGRRGAFDAATRRVIGILANQAAAALANMRTVERSIQLAARDGLTALYNRRAFEELLAKALAREERQQGRLGLLLLDIDHFKKLNDTYGHLAGDAALRAVGQVLESRLRRGDQTARYGGEEFAAILPGTDEAGAVRLAERVRKGLSDTRIVHEGARLSLTASLGVSVWPQDAADASALLAAADRALYAAKAAGRDRVAAASASGLARPSPSGT